VNASHAPGIAQPLAPLIQRGMSRLMVGRLYCCMNVELMMGIAALVSNIVQTQNLRCPCTEIFILTIGRAPNRGGVPWANCIFALCSFLLGFTFFACFLVC
jgi:hypothetical protein